MRLFKKQAGKKPAVPENSGFLKKEKTLNCPRDNTLMEKKTREGITIDKCPTCGGLWLDKGEMNNILQRIEEENKKLKNKTKK